MAAGLSSGAFAADLIVNEPAPAVGVVDVGGNWDGPYVGVFAGYGWGVADHTSQNPGNDLDLSGWLVGATVGANFTVGSGLVVGVVGDAAWSNITGEDSFMISDISHTIDWMATLRGKVGFDGGAFMPYLTAGLAVAGATRDAKSFDSDTQTHVGWTAGAGVEFAATEQMSINLEYLYADLGEREYDTGGIPPTIHLTTNQVRLGLNWHF
ncbi:outer membrane beta-barrel protein [Devosia sp.]|uniref:outer membrane protein n=1 Tax=Devosia sp. TaxID=1871048 RepID=UPI0025C62C46|nr:outer membrane beta-barrel protein [Devosia sp.]